MFTDFLTKVFETRRAHPALIGPGWEVSYADLLDRIADFRRGLRQAGMPPHTVVALSATADPGFPALLLALLEEAHIVVLYPEDTPQRASLLETARAECTLLPHPDGTFTTAPLAGRARHPLYDSLRCQRHPGLVLFTTGTTGPRKAAVHDFTRLSRKYRRPGKDLRTLLFFPFDHIGGLDTLLYGLSNGSSLVVPFDRTPDAVGDAVARHRVEVMPVSPSFLTRFFWSEAHLRYDLSSLRYVTFGAEVMPEALYQKCRAVWPEVTLIQKYGTTELGTLPGRTKAGAALWLRLDGPGVETRLHDGRLQVRAETAMLGYLNAPTPFTADGWYDTGDLTRSEDGYYRIQGRAAEVINVGGENVIPADVEAVIREMDHVLDVIVYGSPNMILGNIVCATVYLSQQEADKKLLSRIQAYCRSRLPVYQIPVKVTGIPGPAPPVRVKKTRRLSPPDAGADTSAGAVSGTTHPDLSE